MRAKNRSAGLDSSVSLAWLRMTVASPSARDNVLRATP